MNSIKSFIFESQEKDPAKFATVICYNQAVLSQSTVRKFPNQGTASKDSSVDLGDSILINLEGLTTQEKLLEHRTQHQRLQLNRLRKKVMLRVTKYFQIIRVKKGVLITIQHRFWNQRHSF